MSGQLGSFSNGGLGMGVAFTLQDHFSNTARQIEGSMAQLSDHTEALERKMNASLNMIKTGVGMAAVGAVMVAPFVAGVEAASDLQENINKVDVTFGQYAERVKAFGDKALENFGIDKIMALDMASLFGDMATGMGFNQLQAAGMSEKLVGLAGDLSSFKNVSHDVAKNALKGIFTGEGESLKNLGIVMTEANLAQYALSQGINKQIKDMSQAEKVQLRYNYVMAMSKNSIGDFARTTDSYANSKRIFQGSIREMSASLGGILMPMFARTFQWASGLLKKLNQFSQTKVGKTVMQIVVAIGAFLIVGGLALILVGGLRIGIMKMAGAFGAATRAQILQTIATQGLTAGLRQMAVAAWASLGPYALIVVAIVAMIAVMYKAWDMVTNGSETMARFGAYLFWILGPIGWIVGAIAGITRGFSELKKPLEEIQTTGIIGFFTKIAGVIEAVKQIWSSWNGETFTLTDELAAKLEKLGILPLVLKISQFVVRIKQFFMGLKEGLAPIGEIFERLGNTIKERVLVIFNRLGDAFSRIWQQFKTSFKPIADLIDRIREKLFSGSESLVTWKNIGQAVGFAITLAIDLIVGAIEGVITVISWLIEGFIWLWETVVTGLIWLYGKWISMWTGIGEFLSGFFNWVLTLPLRLYTAGVNFVTNLWEGIKSIWGSLVSWIDEKISALVDKIVKPLSKAWDFVKTGGGLWGDEENPEDNPVGGGGNFRPRPAMANTFHYNTSKNPTVTNNNYAMGGAGLQPIVLQNYMDGDLISERTIEKTNQKKARYNG